MLLKVSTTQSCRPNDSGKGGVRDLAHAFSQRQWLRMFGAIVKIRSAGTLSISVLGKRSAVSSYLRRLSLRFLLKRELLHIRENGPGGIRTRICDCDRVLCSPYTTGPACSVPRLAQDRKAMRHNSRLRVSKWKYGCSDGIWTGYLWSLFVWIGPCGGSSAFFQGMDRIR